MHNVKLCIPQYNAFVLNHRTEYKLWSLFFFWLVWSKIDLKFKNNHLPFQGDQHMQFDEVMWPYCSTLRCVTVPSEFWIKETFEQNVWCRCTTIYGTPVDRPSGSKQCFNRVWGARLRTEEVMRKRIDSLRASLHPLMHLAEFRH